MRVEIVTIELDEHYYQWLKSARGERGTMSEVVMVLPRPGGRVLTLTKSFYPQGTYNLPSGGIEPGETPETAFTREVAEETGLDVVLRSEIGRIERHCTFGDSSLDFTSHVMLGSESDTPARPRDADESISEYVDASPADLRRFSEHMQNLTGSWAGFGRFRAVALDFVADALADSPALLSN